MIVLSKLRGVTGTLDTDTSVFTPREWTVEEVVLAKLNGVTGVLNKTNNTFTAREWTEEETSRYNAITIV